jgi:hypothetical protein
MPVVRRWLPLPAMAIGVLWVGSLHSGVLHSEVAPRVTADSPTGTGGAHAVVPSEAARRYRIDGRVRSHRP